MFIRQLLWQMPLKTLFGYRDSICWNDDRMEASEVPAHGYAFKGLHASGLCGSVVNKMKALVLMANAYRKALKIIDEFKPDIAIGFGGYVSAPVMLAAHKNM